MIEQLRRLPGFGSLDSEALDVIVSRGTVRSYAPGQLVLPDGAIADLLFARLEGSLLAPDGSTAPDVFDAPGLLFGLAVAGDHVAGPTGYQALAIAKPHVFTIAREFPEFIVSLTDAAEAAA